MVMASTSVIRIGPKSIGSGEPVFIIAEAGVNHNGDLHRAKKLVDAAAEAGADAVKFQTFRADELVSASAPKARYQKETTGTDESQLEMIKRLELSADAFQELSTHCESRKILFLSSPFDPQSVDLLENLNILAYKVPSGEINNWPFLEHIASKHKPVILSTGMCYLSEVDEAIRVLGSAGCTELALLHCTSSYPASAASSNLRAMQTLAEAFQIPVGLSDHTLGAEIPLAAVALGGCIIEKHLTLDKSLPGPDHQASMDPIELRSLIRAIRSVESAMGDGIKRPNASEEDVRNVARRSILTRQAIPQGARITRDMLVFKRPGTGIPPSKLSTVVGRRAAREIPADTLIQFEDL
jgi:N,N'-diacetyllegionaminate synthase